MGSVSLLSGQPKEDVSLEARSESSGYYEETVTDSSGDYRLRGLLPDTTYLVRVVDKESGKGTKIERASPEFVHIKVGLYLIILILSEVSFPYQTWLKIVWKCFISL